MKFKRISVRNFLVFGDKPQVVNLDHQGLILIDGTNEDANSFQSNGSGKSSILSAIPYAIYGNLPDGTAGDDVINNKVKKNLAVKLFFEVDKVNYCIERYRKDSKNKNKVLLYRDNKNITKASVKQTNQYIQDLIGISQETFLNSVLFGLGGKVKFTQATDAEKKKLLEDIANISIFKQAQVIAKADLKAAQDEQSTLELTKANIVKTLDNFKLQADANKKALLAYNEQLESLKQRFTKAADQYQTALGTYQQHNWKAILPSLKEKQKNLTVAIKNLGAKGKSDQNTAAFKLQDLKHRISNTKDKISSLEQSAQDAYQRLQDISTSKQPVCPFCKQPLDSAHLLDEIKRCQQDYQNATKQVTELETTVQQYQQEVESLQPQLIKEQEESKNLESLVNGQQECTLKISQEAQENQALQLALQNYNLSKSELDNAPKQPELYTLSENEVKDTQQQYDTVSEQLKQAEVKIQKLTDTVEIYSDRGVVSHVLDLVMPYINQQANYYLSQLTDNSIMVNIKPQTKAKNGNLSEKLDIEIHNLNGGDQYELNSTGEKKRIDLAISLALQDYVMSKATTQTNLIGYDEIFDGLDGIGTQRVMSLLKDRIKTVPSVFVISHNTELQELFEHTLKIIKNKGMSTIEQEET